MFVREILLWLRDPFGMILPLDDGLAWMRTVALFNPLMYLVDAEQALLGGAAADPAVTRGVLAAVPTCVVGLVVGIRQTRRTA